MVHALAGSWGAWRLVPGSAVAARLAGPDVEEYPRPQPTRDSGVAQVFISYAKRDAETAKIVASALRQNGLSVWFDEALQPSDDWRKRIQHEIDHAKCVVTLWSQIALDSVWVVAEADRADSQGKLLNARIDDVVPPLPFGRLQAVDLRHIDHRFDNPQLLALVVAVQRSLEVGADARESAHRQRPDPAQDTAAVRRWRVIGEELRADRYRTYIREFPDSPFVGQAEARLAELKAWEQVQKDARAGRLDDPFIILTFIETAPYPALARQARAEMEIVATRRREQASQAAVGQYLMYTFLDVGVPAIGGALVLAMGVGLMYRTVIRQRDPAVFVEALEQLDAWLAPLGLPEWVTLSGLLYYNVALLALGLALLGLWWSRFSIGPPSMLETARQTVSRWMSWEQERL